MLNLNYHTSLLHIYRLFTDFFLIFFWPFFFLTWTLSAGIVFIQINKTFVVMYSYLIVNFFKTTHNCSKQALGFKDTQGVNHKDTTHHYDFHHDLCLLDYALPSQLSVCDHRMSANKGLNSNEQLRNRENMDPIFVKNLYKKAIFF